MQHRFDRDTALEHTSDGGFRTRLDRGWWISRGPNGGYIAAILLRAAVQAVADGERAPRSLSVHYTAPPAEGEARLQARVERSGRSLSTVSVRMTQGSRLLALALAALSKPFGGPELDETRMPEVPPPETCEPLVPEPRVVPIRARYDCRNVFGSPSGPGGLAGGWIRTAEPRVADALLVAAFTDAWYPSVYSWSPERMRGRGTPTVDLTIHLRASLPAPGARADDFYLALFRTRLLRDGFLEEEGEIWSRNGQLLAQSRQLAVAL
jgi:acyl-CoA thioesterase